METFLYLLLAVAVSVAVFGFAKLMAAAEDIECPPAPTYPPPTRRTSVTPAGMRRRRRNGGFYPVGYAGACYSGEDLIDEILFAAEIAAYDEMIEENVTEPVIRVDTSE